VSGFANETKKRPVPRLSSCIKQDHRQALYRAIQPGTTSRAGSLYSVAKKLAFLSCLLIETVNCND
jgi:hypothetical protein